MHSHRAGGGGEAEPGCSQDTPRDVGVSPAAGTSHRLGSMPRVPSQPRGASRGGCTSGMRQEEVAGLGGEEVTPDRAQPQLETTPTPAWMAQGGLDLLKKYGY